MAKHANPLVAELHIAAMSAMMQATMMTQALNVARPRSNYQPQGLVNDADYQPISTSEVTMRAHRLVGEIIGHCEMN